MENVSYIATRDVMNSKSDRIFRHPVAFNHYSHLEQYYAVESRVFMSKMVKDENGNIQYERTHLWFTNEVVFDFDFDEEHVKGKTDLELEGMLQNGINRIEALLGKPKYVIKNRTEFTDFEVGRYFTKGDEVKLPKRWGAQLVYELAESLQSQFVERVALYHQARLAVTRMVGADPNFKGHMFKNYRSELFKVEKFEQKPLSLFDLAVAAGFEREHVERVLSLKAGEHLERNLCKTMQRYNRRLVNWYMNLNTFKRQGGFKSKRNINWNAIKCGSRNVTLFNYLCALGIDSIRELEYERVVSSQLFDQCDLQEPMSREEFESTRDSVVSWRESGGLEPEAFDAGDSRVFKLNFQPLNREFFDAFKGMSMDKMGKFAEIKFVGHKRSEPVKEHTIRVPLYEENSAETALANIFLHLGGFNILENVRSLVTNESLDWIKLNLEKWFQEDHGLDDLYHAVCSALYLTHFRLYGSIREWRATKSISASTTGISDATEASSIRTIWMVPSYRSSDDHTILSYACRFKRVYAQLKREGHLNENGLAKPISYYQSLFHVKNADASLYVKIIKMYLLVQKALIGRVRHSAFCVPFNIYVNSNFNTYLIRDFIIINGEYTNRYGRNKLLPWEYDPLLYGMIGKRYLGLHADVNTS
jgi:hypothetical protein